MTEHHKRVASILSEQRPHGFRQGERPFGEADVLWLDIMSDLSFYFQSEDPDFKSDDFTRECFS